MSSVFSESFLLSLSSVVFGLSFLFVAGSVSGFVDGSVGVVLVCEGIVGVAVAGALSVSLPIPPDCSFLLFFWLIYFSISFFLSLEGLYWILDK